MSRRRAQTCRKCGVGAAARGMSSSLAWHRVSWASHNYHITVTLSLLQSQSAIHPAGAAQSKLLINYKVSWCLPLATHSSPKYSVTERRSSYICFSSACQCKGGRCRVAATAQWKAWWSDGKACRGAVHLGMQGRICNAQAAQEMYDLTISPRAPGTPQQRQHGSPPSPR